MPSDRETHPPAGPRDATAPAPPPPPRRGPFAQRAAPWIDLVARLLTAIAAALAIWKALG